MIQWGERCRTSARRRTRSMRSSSNLTDVAISYIAG
jgi:hypothetical protein